MSGFIENVTEIKSISTPIATQADTFVNVALGDLSTTVAKVSSPLLQEIGKGAVADSYADTTKLIEEEAKSAAQDPDYYTKARASLDALDKRIPNSSVKQLKLLDLRRKMVASAAGNTRELEGIDKAFTAVTGFVSPARKLMMQQDAAELVEINNAVKKRSDTIKRGRDNNLVGTDTEVYDSMLAADAQGLNLKQLVTSSGGGKSGAKSPTGSINAKRLPELIDFNKKNSPVFIKTYIMPLVRTAIEGDDEAKLVARRALSGVMSSTTDNLMRMQYTGNAPIMLNAAEINVAYKDVKTYLNTMGFTAEQLNSKNISTDAEAYMKRQLALDNFIDQQGVRADPTLRKLQLLSALKVPQEIIKEIIMNFDATKKAIDKMVASTGSELDSSKVISNSVDYLVLGKGNPNNFDKAKMVINQAIAITALSKSNTPPAKSEARVIDAATTDTTAIRTNNKNLMALIQTMGSPTGVEATKEAFKVDPVLAAKAVARYNVVGIGRITQLIEAAKLDERGDITFDGNKFVAATGSTLTLNEQGNFVGSVEHASVRNAVEEANTILTGLNTYKQFGAHKDLPMKEWFEQITNPLLNAPSKESVWTQKIGFGMDNIVETVSNLSVDGFKRITSEIAETAGDFSNTNIAKPITNFLNNVQLPELPDGLNKVKESIQKITKDTLVKDLNSGLMTGAGNFIGWADDLVNGTSPVVRQDQTNVIAADDLKVKNDRVVIDRALYFGGVAEIVTQFEGPITTPSVFNMFRDSSADPNQSKAFTWAIGYGHQLTAKERKQGFILIKGDANKSARGIPGFIGDEDIKIYFEDGISPEEAMLVRDKDLQWAVKAFETSLKKAGKFNERMSAAGSSLVYNVGESAWKKSRARKNLEAGDYEGFMFEAFSEQEGFVNSYQALGGSGNTVWTSNKGLIVRRGKEEKLFKKGMAELLEASKITTSSPVASKPPQPPAVPEITPQTLEEELTEMKTEQAVDTYLKSMIETGVSLPTLQYMADTSNPNVSVGNRIALRAAIDRYEKEQEDVGI